MIEFYKDKIYFRGNCLFRLSMSDFDEYKWEVKMPTEDWRKYKVRSPSMLKDHENNLHLFSPVIAEFFNLEGIYD